MRLLTGVSKSVEGGSDKSTLNVWIPWWLHFRKERLRCIKLYNVVDRASRHQSVYPHIYAKFKWREYMPP